MKDLLKNSIFNGVSYLMRNNFNEFYGFRLSAGFY